MLPFILFEDWWKHGPLIYDDGLYKVGYIGGKRYFPSFEDFLLLFVSIHSQILAVLDGKLSAEATFLGYTSLL